MISVCLYSFLCIDTLGVTQPHKKLGLSTLLFYIHNIQAFHFHSNLPLLISIMSIHSKSKTEEPSDEGTNHWTLSTTSRPLTLYPGGFLLPKSHICMCIIGYNCGCQSNISLVMIMFLNWWCECWCWLVNDRFSMEYVV